MLFLLLVKRDNKRQIKVTCETGNNAKEGELTLTTGSSMFMSMEQYQKKHQEIEELQKCVTTWQETIEIKNVTE